MIDSPADLIERALAWIDIDPDRETVAALQTMIDAARAGSTQDLIEHMGTRVVFGTAGLRAKMGPGSNRINRVIAHQTGLGLGHALIDHAEAASERGVLIGYDGRHRSERFADDIADALAELRIRSIIVPGPNPTPLVAWGMRHLGNAAGVVVTASHNPAADNGIKIYWGDGAQIIPPVDAWIANAIDEAATTDVGCGHSNNRSPLIESAPAALTDAYVEMVTQLLAEDGPIGIGSADRAPLRIAATAMHGVGAPLLKRCLADVGFEDLHTVAEQNEPDPEFPTIVFPNPEEPGATDLLIALATDVGADVAFANDPDADRLAVGVPTAKGWRMLSGDELGAVLGEGLMERYSSPRTPLLVTTVVSSQLLGRIAERAGAVFHETLTGFKWLCRPGFDSPELNQVLTYEESIGYAVGGLCDKDGISAAVVVADVLARWKSQGISVQHVLDQLARTHGAHVQNNFSLRVEGPGAQPRLATMAASVIANPPTDLGGVAVAQMNQPAADVIRLTLTNGDRVIIRPSGTEPKLKFYCEAVEPVSTDESPDDARSRAGARLALMNTDLRGRFRPE